MIVAIVGSRDFPKLTRVDQRIAQLRDFQASCDIPVKIISGGARGIDSRARVVCRDYGYIADFEEFPADWESDGKAAGYKRNERLIEMADLVIAFWDGESKGTKHTIDLALKHKKHLEVHFP